MCQKVNLILILANHNLNGGEYFTSSAISCTLSLLLKTWNNLSEKLNRLTCLDGLHKFGVVLGSQQGLVVPWVPLQLILSPTGCHPDQSPVLIGNSFAYVTLYWNRGEYLCWVHIYGLCELCECVLFSYSHFIFFCTLLLPFSSLDHLMARRVSTTRYSDMSSSYDS